MFPKDCTTRRSLPTYSLPQPDRERCVNHCGPDSRRSGRKVRTLDIRPVTAEAALQVSAVLGEAVFCRLWASPASSSARLARCAGSGRREPRVVRLIHAELVE